MTTTWLSGAKKDDLSGHRGNGPFGAGALLGVILHVNVDEHGTSDAFFESNPEEVTPNFEVYKDGSVHQYLPFDWQPWCQIDGNFRYAAIETAGMPDEPLTDAQLKSIARIMAIYHAEYGVSLELAEQPGQKGLGTHQMGGPAWGDHACPGAIRAGQRHDILALASGGTIQEDDPLMTMDPKERQALIDDISAGVWGKTLEDSAGNKHVARVWLIGTNVAAHQAANIAAQLVSAVAGVTAILGTAKVGVAQRVAALQAAVAALKPAAIEEADAEKVADATSAKVLAGLKAITFGAK